MSKEFAAMEDAAMKAYEEDMKRLKAEAETTVQVQEKSNISKAGDIAEPYSKHELYDWVQGTTDSGQIYYYNTTTRESTWEKTSVPSSKGVSLAKINVEGQAQLVSQPDFSSGKAAQSSKQLYCPKISFRKQKKEVTILLGNDNKKTIENLESFVPPKKKKDPARKPEKANPYGKWEQVQEDEDLYKDVDLQLPQKESENSISTSSVPLEPKTKFKERTVTLQEDESSLGTIFKKRKMDNGKARSLRQRGKED
ncbi:WW domain-binding protein 4 [Bagarius yarrelli]|uniref:WW domain-binding protein 4 n=1 Tax=Bagarius yarrelli TaxID=175774 RepID=A0A556V873_BAGYA|nr:WW domain-binding protein 4 [Bagarius yarrelli]